MSLYYFKQLITAYLTILHLSGILMYVMIQIANINEGPTTFSILVLILVLEYLQYQFSTTFFAVCDLDLTIFPTEQLKFSIFILK